MKHLFLSEWHRFRRYALAVGVVHALALLFLSRVTNLVQRPYDDHAAMLFLYMAIGLVLGVVQVGSYRKPSQWLWLMHRPLSPPRIFASLALSALALLGVAILVPLVVFVAATDLFTTQVVDARHYAALLHVLAFSAMAWLAGAITCTYRRKATIAVLAVPLLLALHLASVWVLFVPVAICLAWLGWVALHGFRADREAPIARADVLVLVALPLQLLAFVVLFHLSKAGLDAAELLRPRYPTKTVLATDADADEFMRQYRRRSVLEGLAGSRDPRAAEWRDQVPLLDVAEVLPDLARFPVRHQIATLSPPRWDEQRRIEWTFSHDRMRFHGRDPKTGEARGWWGEGGAGSTKPFALVPASGMTRDTLYAIDAATQREYALVRLRVGEWFTGQPVRALDHVFVLTNQRVLAYIARTDALVPFAPLRLDWALDTGSDAAPAVNVVELVDGWLVSLYHYPSREVGGYEFLAPSRQQMVYIDDAGTSHVVAERNGMYGHNVTIGSAMLVPRAAWWISPPLYLLARFPDVLLDEGLTQPMPLAPWPIVRGFWAVAAGLMLLSLALGAWWLRGVPMRASRRRLWLALCVRWGLPALVSLVCLESRALRR
jgi:hypothetical protein